MEGLDSHEQQEWERNRELVIDKGNKVHKDLEDKINKGIPIDIKTNSNWDSINYNPMLLDANHTINLYNPINGFVQFYPITPKEAFKGKDLNLTMTEQGYIKEYIGRPREDFEKEVKEMSKYYNADILVENENTGKLKELFSKSYSDINPKKQKIVTINDKIIKYTHCVPTNIVIIKLTWKQKLKLLLGLKVNAIVNTYLNGGKVELTVLKIEE